MSRAALGLGTVQWGIPYGIANKAGQTPRSEVRVILERARAHGVKLLDTASQYGEAEIVLSENNPSAFQIVTKTPSFGGESITPEHALALANTFRGSLERLGVDLTYGLLLHRVDDLFRPGGEKLLRVMEDLKEQGLVRKIGISVYDEQQIDAVLRLFTPDIVQLPFNVLDQRLLQSGHIAKLHDAGAEIHVRSVFLQGLLLMRLAQVPEYFDPIRPLLVRWHEAAADQDMTPIQAALAFVRDTAGVDVVLVGVENAKQINDCISDFGLDTTFGAAGLACNDKHYVNPTCWKAN